MSFRVKDPDPRIKGVGSPNDSTGSLILWALLDATSPRLDPRLDNDMPVLLTSTLESEEKQREERGANATLLETEAKARQYSNKARVRCFCLERNRRDTLLLLVL